MLVEHPPSKPPLKIGDEFSTRTGPRRLVYPGNKLYAQLDGRRYYCECVTSENERYIDGWRRVRLRCRMQLRVIAV